MTFKQLILVLTITVSILTMSLLGVSYAWYSFSDPETEFEVTTTDSEFGVVFAQSSYVSLNSAVPITEEESPEKAGISRFYITPNDGVEDANISVKLVNIQIDEELKNEWFKIQLYAEERDYMVYDGSGSDITSDSLNLLSQASIINSENTIYELRVWIEDAGYDDNGNPIDQNDLMGKSFSAQIQVSSLVG